MSRKLKTDITSRMKIARVLVPNTFYSVGWKGLGVEETPFAIWSEKKYWNEQLQADRRTELGVIWSGEIVFYVKKAGWGMHKIGYADFFGLIYDDCVDFYEVDLSGV